jgi:hypothetical protein
MTVANFSPARPLYSPAARNRRITPDALAWLNDSPSNDFADYPGVGWSDPEGPAPSWDAMTFNPDEYAAAWVAGFARGRDLDLSRLPPGSTPAHTRLSWFAGFSEGLAEAKTRDPEAYFAELMRVEDVREYHRDMMAWLDRIDREDRERMQEEVEDPAGHVHPDEVARAVGLAGLRAAV